MQEPLLGVRRMLLPRAPHGPWGWVGLIGPCGMKAWMCSALGSEISRPTKAIYLGEHRDQTMLGVACKGLVSFLSLLDMNQGSFSLC